MPAGIGPLTGGRIWLRDGDTGFRTQSEGPSTGARPAAGVQGAQSGLFKMPDLPLMTRKVVSGWVCFPFWVQTPRVILHSSCNKRLGMRSKADSEPALRVQGL